MVLAASLGWSYLVLAALTTTADDCYIKSPGLKTTVSMPRLARSTGCLDLRRMEKTICTEASSRFMRTRGVFGSRFDACRTA